MGLPMTSRSPPSASCSSRMRATALSPGMRVVLSHVSSASPSTSDRTYFGMAFIRSANGSPARSGHAAAIDCHVRRPNNSTSALVSASSKAPPTTSGSKKGCDQPPWAKPPSVSSSGPPGACTTPSKLMNSLITMRTGLAPLPHPGQLQERLRGRSKIIAPSGSRIRRGGQGMCRMSLAAASHVPP